MVQNSNAINSKLLSLVQIHGWIYLDLLSERTQSVPDTQGELQTTSVSISCRCGQSGDEIPSANGLPLIQCFVCQMWSHVSCQRLGRADGLKKDEHFTCDGCNGMDLVLDG